MCYNTAFQRQQHLNTARKKSIWCGHDTFAAGHGCPRVQNGCPKQRQLNPLCAVRRLNRQTSQIPQAPLCGEVHSDAHRSTRSKGAGQNLLWCEMSEVVPQRGTLDPERTLARMERPPCCWWLGTMLVTTQHKNCRAHPVLM